MNDPWIKCSDRMPKHQDKILMTYNDLVMEGRCFKGKFFHPSICAHTEGYCDCEEQEGITHWMSLPKPPKDDE
jgi:hypothetical protein